MGLATFNRARRRHAEEGAGAIFASAPTPTFIKGKYVKQDTALKQYCSVCDKHFNNTAAYETHMQYKHTDLWLENNKFEDLPKALQKKLNLTKD